MKALIFLPFCFVAGVEGFDLFAPYVALLMMLAPLLVYIQRRLRDRGSAAAAVPSEPPRDAEKSALSPAAV